MATRLIIVSFALLAGCTSLSEVYLQSSELVKNSYLFTTAETSRSSAWVLPRQTHFYLARNSELTELNSLHSQALTEVIAQAIANNFRNPTVGGLPESLAQALTSADAVAADFLVFPSILIWDDRVSTWQETFDSLRYRGSIEVAEFGLDKTRLQLVVMHAATGKVMDVVRIDSSSGVLTLYEDTPDKVVYPSLKSFFAGLVAASG